MLREKCGFAFICLFLKQSLMMIDHFRRADVCGLFGECTLVQALLVSDNHAM